MKKANFIYIGTILSLVLCMFFVFNTRSISAAEKVRLNLEGIDESIQNEVSNRTKLALSSNPYDYIADNTYYNSIIDIGVPALAELEDTLKRSEQNGLNEYILAIAIEEISRANVNAILGNVDYGWENAKEFLSEWTDIKLSATNNVESIIQSKTLTEEEKLMKVKDYGILAVPAINSYLSTSESRKSDELVGKLNSLLESYELGKNNAIISDYLNE